MNKLSWLALAGVLVSNAALATPRESHLSVSSDGSAAPEVAGPTLPQPGFRGQQQPGQPLDAEAEFPAQRLTAAEMEAFAATFRPKLPPYANVIAPESVLSSDRRFRLLPKESGYPYRAVGLLTFSQAGGSYTCTGWLIGADTVATAGHCVHSGGAGGAWSTNVVFHPARNGGTSPYGSCSSRRLYSVNGWTGSANAEYDYGAVKLNCTIGNSTGWLGRWWTTSSQLNLPIAVIGYPGDKPSATQWGGAGRVAASETRKTRYFIDTAGGQSGSPVVQADGTGPGGCQGDCGIAIHAYGADGAGRNSGTRITEAVSNNMQSWITAP